MDVRIDELLSLMRKRIETTDDEKFKLSASNIIKMLARTDPTLRHRTSR